MRSKTNHAFPAEVIRALKTYVYRLIDPRNGETFYVGKGRGNRVFAHISEELTSDDPGDKLSRIRDIRLAGFEVGHVIHRHGLDEKTAFEVEAALIDAYPGLTNIAGGSGSNEYGAMHAGEIIQRHAAIEATFKHKALMINVNRSAAETSLYEATRYAWKISRKRALEAEVILSVRQGVIVGAFVAHDWLKATPENFPQHEPMPKRLAFVGAPAPEKLAQQYVGKRIPDRFRKKGASNPIKYSWAK